MIGFLISVVSLVAGIIATVLVGRYYFERTVDKALTPFVMTLSDVLSGVRHEMRDALRIEYQGVEVSALTDIRLLIGNTGERPIRDVLDPMTLTLPNGVEVLDLDVVHVQPKGRSVEVENDATENPPRVIFRFPLLNSAEFFIVRLLLKGSVGFDDLRFTITAEDLPPALEPAPFSPAYSSRFRRSVDLGSFGLAALSAAISAALAYLVLSVWTNQIATRSGPIVARVSHDLLLSASLTVAAAVAILAAVVTAFAFLAGLSEVPWPTLRSRKPVFDIPLELATFQMFRRRRSLESQAKRHA